MWQGLRKSVSQLLRAQKIKKNIRIVKIHNHKIKTGQAGQDYDTYYI